MLTSKYPSLYQINTRVWLREKWGPEATLKDIPDEELDELAGKGFDWIYLLSVWQTGEAGKEMSRKNPQWTSSYREGLPDLKEEDICGSGFAITAYELNNMLGEPGELVSLKERLNARGMRLMLDFVPNHVALDHPWTREHPEYFISGSEKDLEVHPDNFTRLGKHPEKPVFAYGRDPYFSGWVDTLQLNYGDAGLRKAMLEELMSISELCDGLRVDMAMLITQGVFKKTWGIDIPPFWPQAIEKVKGIKKDFTFLGEVYWDMEWEMQQQGFDFTYDKRLYDRLLNKQATPVRLHLRAAPDFQDKLCRFLENHDEKRAAKEFDNEVHFAAAVITYLTPGMRFFHQGQPEGWKSKLSVHLCRRRIEKGDRDIKGFYDSLLNLLKNGLFRNGKWKLLDIREKDGREITEPSLIAFEWSENGERAVVAVNYSPEKVSGQLELKEKEGAGAGIGLGLGIGVGVGIGIGEGIGGKGEDNTEVVVKDGKMEVQLEPWGIKIFSIKQ